ncbi:cupin domain-containing protein [Kitasatospora sp. NPDC052896]|uniref:cupin domain-containing protein n=1 Tax=Kitasatospora sp. NPDC052896 TaxID=3364061 RepID=UPI0037C63F86
MAYLANRDQHQTLEWLDGGLFTILLDSQATQGQLTVGRFDVPKGEAPPFHVHTRDDEVFLLLKGEALVWVGDEQHELSEGGIVYLPRNIPHGYRITSDRADLLLIATPAGIEEMFRHAGRDITTSRPEGFKLGKDKLAEAAALCGNLILGPPR